MRGGTVAGSADRSAIDPGDWGRVRDRREPRAARRSQPGRACGGAAMGRGRCRRRGAPPGDRRAPDVGFVWEFVFVVQIPVVLLALPASVALRGGVVRRKASLDTSPD